MIDSLKTTLNGYLVSNSQLTVPKVYQCDRSIPKHLAIKITGQEQGSLSSRRGTKSKAVPLAFDSGMWQVISAKWLCPTSLSASFRWKDDSVKIHTIHTHKCLSKIVGSCWTHGSSTCWINRGMGLVSQLRRPPLWNKEFQDWVQIEIKWLQLMWTRHC